MKILGDQVINRTENWKTARYFSPFFKDKAARLRLAKKLREPDETQASEVCIELFWYGIRDHFCPNDEKKRKGYYKNAKENHREDLQKLYRHLFIKEIDLRAKVEKSGLFSELGTDNYDLFTENSGDGLFDNLFHTEIDIVLETPENLYIGEAKHETGFGNAKSKYVLVHQLIRQYVTATILLKYLGVNKQVVPFVVRSTLTKNEYAQVDFMIQQCWMSENNVLTWEDIKKLWPPLTANGAQSTV